MTTIEDHTMSATGDPSPDPNGAVTFSDPGSMADVLAADHEPTSARACELRDEIVALSSLMANETYELLHLVAEFDACGAFTLFGALSCAAWLAEVCDIHVGSARNHVRVARAMVRWEALDAAMASGDISYSKARVLVPYCQDDNIDALVELAMCHPAGRLRTALAVWLVDHEDPSFIELIQHEQRSVTWRTEPNGMVTLTACLEPAVAGQVCAVIDEALLTAKKDGDAPAGARETTSPTLRQQHADAFARVVLQGGAQLTTEMVVHVRHDGNTLTDGTPLSDHAVTKLLPTAFVSLLLHDAKRQPIDASPRRRFPTRRQRRVIDERARECAEPGCHATAFLQYDHIVPFRAGGETVLDNLRPLCGPHNRGREPAHNQR